MAPTNRPFFHNFFSAFRAHTSPTAAFPAKSSPSATSPTAHTSVTTSTITNNATTQPRTITTKTSSTTPVADVTSPTTATAHRPAHHTSSVAFSPNSTTRYAANPLSRSPGSTSPGPYSSHNHHTPPGTNTPLGNTRGRQRRGSDSSNSSGGFMDALGSEKWYVGGRAANGEETFYRLGLVGNNVNGGKTRVRSLDRLSL